MILGLLTQTTDLLITRATVFGLLSVFLPLNYHMASLWTRNALAPHIHSLSTSRRITHSATKAQPFFVNSLRSPVNYENGDRKVLRMLMFGKPGAGKGTLSAKLVKKYDIMALSTGDLLRQHIAEK
jgi:nucleoside-triphosphate--adenylate kinase